MYIQPNSIVKLLIDIPIDPNQNDTLWFGSPLTQYQYFTEDRRVARTFTSVTYVRENRGKIRVPIKADFIQQVNYMMYQNTSYDNKWFYAFVDKIDYVNDNTTEVTFTIDPIQTWFFEYEIGECFVERETVSDDSRGIHFEPETINVGEYVTNSYNTIGNNFNDTIIVLAYNTGAALGRIYDKVYSGVKLKGYPNNEIGVVALNREIATITADQKYDNIVGIYMCPSALLRTQPTPDTGYDIDPSYTGKIISDNFPSINSLISLDGYVPHNNKLFTYPYNFFMVDTPDGNSAVYRYEFFKDYEPNFHIKGNITSPVEITCTPVDYKTNRNLSDVEYRGDRLVLKGFPMCNWSASYFSSWLAENSVPRTARIVSTTASVISSFARGSVSGGIVTAVSTASDMISDYIVASNHADLHKGGITTGSCDFANNNMNFKGGQMSVNRIMAKRIDDYFTAFGYQIAVIKRPSRRNRTRFTYVKTVGASVSGGLPSDDARYISSCYDKGIRFWADTTYVKNYDLDTHPNLSL